MQYCQRLAISLAILVLAAAPGCRPPEPDGEAAAGDQPAAGAPATTAAPTTAAPPTTAPPGGVAPATAAPPDIAAPLPADRLLRAGFLVVDGVYNTELAAPYDVLQHTVFHVQPGVEVFTVSPDGRPVTTFEGLRLSPHYSFATAPEIDILVVPSAKGSMDADLENAALIDWVRRAGSRARYVLSLCDGAFVLAKAGLLDGRAATTFPDDYERFARLFPAVDLRVNVSFVQDGRAVTSQGGARSYAAALHLAQQLYGLEVAKKIAHGLLVTWPPIAGEQPLFVVEDVPPPATP
jgi:transcriptional regulator GlxA family with amidase domain